jgi:hypothetical protein
MGLPNLLDTSRALTPKLAQARHRCAAWKTYRKAYQNGADTSRSPGSHRLTARPLSRIGLCRRRGKSEFFRPRDSQFSVPPRSVCEQHRGKTPVVAEILKIHITAKLGGWKEENSGFLQTSIDAPVLPFPLLPVPTRQAVFNLAVRSFVLFDDAHANLLASSRRELNLKSAGQS